MRINTTPAAETGVIKGSSTLPLAASVEEGQTLNARVLTNENGSVTLKTESGQLIRARLEGDVQLAPGDKVTLSVSEKTTDALLLTVVEPEGGAGAGAARASAPAMDKSLAAFASKLSQLCLPVTEETVTAMRDLMAENPKLTMDEAAFLAANRISADTPLAAAARALINSGAAIDKLAGEIMILLGDASEPPSGAPAAPEGMDGKAGTTGALPENTAAAGTTGALPENTAAAGTTSALPENTAAAGTTGALPENTAAADTTGALPENTAAAGTTSALPENTAASETAGAASGSIGNLLETALAAGRAADNEEAPLTQWLSSILDASQTPETDGKPLDAKRAVQEFLSRIPEFGGTPEKALEKFSSMLLDAAAAAAETDGDSAGKLEAMLDGLFKRLPPLGEKGGDAIRQAKEELFVKLAFFEEALSRSDMPGKEALLAKTQELTEHARLLNRIDQFVYMQIPIKLGDERKTAELYVYKNKKRGGSKSIDPENVSILLALDLEHMGHLESFVRVRGREVSLQTEVSTEDARSFFSNNIRPLYEALSGISFKLADARVTCAKEATTPLTALVSLLAHEKRTMTGIDYTV